MQLIFGANGPSGRAYIRTLTDSADTVAVLRRPSEDSFFTEHNIQTVVADALDADALDKALAQYRPDTVISLSAAKRRGYPQRCAGQYQHHCRYESLQSASPLCTDYQHGLRRTMGYDERAVQTGTRRSRPCKNGSRNLSQTKRFELDHLAPLRPCRWRR